MSVGQGWVVCRSCWSLERGLVVGVERAQNGLGAVGHHASQDRVVGDLIAGDQIDQRRWQACDQLGEHIASTQEVV